jgi:hypothetical protein
MDTVQSLITWFAQLAAIAAVLVGPTTAIVATLKTVLDGRLSTNYFPSISVAAGVALGCVVALAAPVATPLWTNVLAGAVAGYSASELYAGAAARDAAKAAALKPTPAIIGIPTLPMPPHDLSNPPLAPWPANTRG